MARRKHVAEALLFHRRVETVAAQKNLTYEVAYKFCEALHLHRTGRRMYSNYSSFTTSKSYLSKKYRQAFKINS